MTRYVRLIPLIALIFALFGRPGAAQDWQLVDANTIAPDTYLILTVSLDDPQPLATLAAQLEADFGVPLAAEWPLQSISVHCLVFDASSSPDIDILIDAMEADDRIRTVQRIQNFSFSETTYPDTLFPLQWALDRMNLMRAHRVSQGNGVQIGVIDSAIDRTHPDLADRVVDARDFVAAIPETRAEAHGTAVAGVIAAEATNDGIVGVAPRAQLVGLRACWQAQGEEGRCNSFSLARALNFAILNKINVLNLSIGGPEDALLEELIDAAVARGIVVVAAAGEGEATAFPASLDNVIAAGSARPGRIPAPMVDVLSTAPGSRHRFVSGSSIATAHVSGVVALMLAKNPAIGNDDLAARLVEAVNNSTDTPMLDACKAVLLLSSAMQECEQ